MSGIPLASSQIVGVVRLLILSFLWIGIILELIYKQTDMQHTWRHLTKMHFLRYVLFIYTFIQMIMLIYGLVHDASELITITSAGTILQFLWFNRKILNKLKIMLQILPSLSLIMIGFAVIILFFAWLGPYLFPLGF